MSSAMDLLHDAGQAIIVSAARPKGKKGRAWNDYSFTSRERAVQFLRKKNAEGLDAYIKHGVFDGAKDGDKRPITGTDHVIGSRTFAIDIDTGVHKDAHYATPKDAIRALITTHKGMAALNIPEPNILQETGGGVLAAWVTDEVIGQAEWLVLQHILHHLYRQYGLNHDNGMKPIDRGIRCCGPDFKNYNHGAPLPTKINFLKPTRISAAHMRRVLIPHKTFAVITNPMVEEEVDEWTIQGQDFKFDLLEVKEDCEIIKEAYATQGKTTGFNEWINVVAVAARHHDKAQGLALAHHMSSEHPNYLKEDTEKRFRSFGSGKRMVLCKTFKESGDHAKKACERCAFHGRVNSLAGIPKIKRQERVAALPALPDDHYFNGAYGVMVRETTPEGENKDAMVLQSYHVTEVLLYEDGGNGGHLTLKISALSGPWRKSLTLELAKLSDVRSMKLAFSSCGFIIKEVEGKRVHNMLGSWIDRLREQNRTQRIHKNLGWSEDGDSFVVGPNVYSPAGHSLIIPPANRVNFSPSGSRKEWINAAQMIMGNELRPEAHALVATAFGAPLMPLVGMSGVALNFYSPKSGRGKTTLSRLAASIWGLPAELSMGVDDTINAAVRRLAELGSLPAYFDETRMADPEGYIRNILYRLASGQEKRRLDSNAREQAVGNWGTGMVFTSNSSFENVLNTSKQHGDATQARYVEMEMGPLPAGSQGNVATIDQLKDVVIRNHGFVGPDYAAYMVANKNLMRNRLRMLAEKLLKVTATDATDVSGRIQAAVGACLVVGAQVAEEKLWLPINARLVLTAVTGALKSSRQDRKTAQVKLHPDEVIIEFLKRKEASRVLTYSVQGKKHLMENHPFTVRPVAYEVDTTAHQIIIDQNEFREYLLERGYNAKSVLFELRGLYQTVRMPIASGTPYRTTGRPMFVINATPTTPFADFT